MSATPAPAPEWSVNRLAARAIALLDLPVAERRELLDMCGLIDETGRDVAPDDTEYYDLFNRFVGFDDDYSQGKMAARFGEAPPLKDNPHLPEGLRNLQPGLLTAAIRKTRGTSVCGTVAGYSAHQRRGEKACVICSEARSQYNKVRRPAKGRYLSPCGTPSAHARHKRRGEPVDEACRQASLAYRAEMKRAARARQKAEGDPA